ncbi:MAG: hypothetical protein D5S00_06365 [Tindallia sp. MSAO_Bac2]|nr:MAG: hypothetical protein D5S00_06365 [Tindallia sp. MSAO_Bac2]
MKRTRFTVLMMVLLWMVAGNILVSGAGQPLITIEINGNPAIFSDARPYIDENNRTMVPVRFASEELGAEVSWNGETQTVTVKRDYDIIQLQMNSSRIWVNGEYQQMDTKMVLNREFNRNYVPLRFVSQSLGASVDFDSLNGEMMITINQEEKRTLTGINSIGIGDSEIYVIEALGKPDRKEPTRYSYHWWVYGSQTGGPYRLVGVDNGKVVAIYTNGEDWEYQGVSIGTRMGNARNILEIQQQNSFRLGPVQYRFSQNINTSENPSDYFIVDDNALLTLYYDIHEDQIVTAARFTALPLVPKLGNMNISWTFPTGYEPDHSLPVLSLEKQEAVNRGNEKIMFDLVNAIRERKGLTELGWREDLSEVAYLHSVDMSENRFFNHQSPTSGDPADRVRAAGISFRRVLENIAMGQMDSIEAHEGLMNSPGHRENILHQEVNALGTGAFELYYTQKFMR